MTSLLVPLLFLDVKFVTSFGETMEYFNNAARSLRILANDLQLIIMGILLREDINYQFLKHRYRTFTIDNVRCLILTVSSASANNSEITYCVNYKSSTVNFAQNTFFIGYEANSWRETIKERIGE